MNLDGKKVTISFVKELINDIAKKELEENNLSCQIFAITRTENLVKMLTHRKYQLYKQNDMAFFNNISGIYSDDDKAILLFLNNADDILCSKILKEDNRFISVIYNLYHEIRHAIQYSERTPYNYINFILSIEHISKVMVPFDYQHFHDFYYSELDADMFAWDKTNQFFKQYPDIYDKNKSIIEQKLILQRKNLFNYNFDVFFSDLLACVQHDYSCLYKFNSWASVFFIADKLQNLNYIMNHPDFSKLDKKIIYSILSTEVFIETCDFSNLTQEERSLMEESLKYKLKNLKVARELDGFDKELENKITAVDNHLENLISNNKSFNHISKR